MKIKLSKSNLEVIILKLHTYSPSVIQKRMCFLLRKTSFGSNNLRRKLNFEGSFKVRLHGKHSFKMNNHSGIIEKETFWNGAFNSFENDLGWIWMELCKFNNTIFDVGANTGIYSLTAKSINPKASVYAFEPSRHSFEKLKENVKLNKYDIKFEQLAVSNNTSKMIFYDLPNSSDNASLSPEKMKNWNGYKGQILEYEVKTTSLQDYIAYNNIPSVGLIKIDIEMHEPEAIEGLNQYLLKYKPIIVLEVLSEGIAEKLNTIFDLDAYELFHLKKWQKAEKLDKFMMPKEYLANWEWNFIIFHIDRKEEIKAQTSLYNNLL